MTEPGYYFMNNNGFYKEIANSSKIDLKNKFYKLEDNIKKDLCKLTEHYFIYLKSIPTMNFFTTIKKGEDEITIEIYFNTVTEKINILYKIEYCEIGMYIQNIIINYGEHKKGKTLCDDILKNSIYNVLFYLKLFKDEFEYNMSCQYYQHKDEIESIAEFYKTYNRLFIDNPPQCCVCLEEINNVYKTPCDHHLCLSCCKQLKKKICPMCRQCFCCNFGECEYDDEDHDEE